MHLLRCLWFFVAYFDITVSATHLPGVTNVTADCLSRNNILQAFQATPVLSMQPSPLPTPVTQIITPLGPDWTSPQFRQLFQKTLSVMQEKFQTIKLYVYGFCVDAQIVCICKLTPPQPIISTIIGSC